MYENKWVMSQTWMSHVTDMNESCHRHEWVMSHDEWVVSHTWTRHVAQVRGAVPMACKRVMSQAWLRHVAQVMSHMNEWYHTHEWVMSHTWMSHVSQVRGVCSKYMCHFLSYLLPLSTHLETATCYEQKGKGERGGDGWGRERRTRECVWEK